jgi:hypothetical protein
VRVFGGRARCSVSDLRRRFGSGAGYPAPGARYPGPGTRYQALVFEKRAHGVCKIQVQDGAAYLTAILDSVRVVTDPVGGSRAGRQSGHKAVGQYGNGAMIGVQDPWLHRMNLSSVRTRSGLRSRVPSSVSGPRLADAEGRIPSTGDRRVRILYPVFIQDETVALGSAFGKAESV